MPRIVMLVEVSEDRIDSFYSNLERSVENDQIEGFFELVIDGESMGSELPYFLRHEAVLSDVVARLERDFIDNERE